MFKDNTAKEIIVNGLSQGAMYGAPSDFMANLRGALAYIEICEENKDKKSFNVSPLTNVIPGEYLDE